MMISSQASTDTSQLIEQLVRYSYDHQLTHVPSALSMLTYVNRLFTDSIIEPYRDRIVLGKPFGSQTYYLVWKNLNWMQDIDHLSVGVKHEEIEFVTYGEETMGNALGVAIGIAIADRSRCVWVNISDATLQMGSTLEAIQYIGHNNITNIILTIDGNDMQVTGGTDDVLTVTPIITLLSEYGWHMQVVDGHDDAQIQRSGYNINSTKPNVIYYNTTKGHGVDMMAQDPVTWHYKKIDETNFRQILKQIQQ